jgi:starch synthase
MRVLFASSEITPLAKTGGLADVSAALPVALANLGIELDLAMPGYPEALDQAQAKQDPIPLGEMLGVGATSLIRARTPDSGLPIWLVDCPALFRRQGGLYVDAEGHEWPDNAPRFALLSHAIVRLALRDIGTDTTPDVVHVNDWHLGLVPALLAAEPRPHPPSILTIHNLAFQGVFPADVFPRLDLPAKWFTPEGVEFYGQVSFLKAGIRFADRLTTVSPSYAREILTPAYGCGLDGLLRARASDLVGILNGIDYNGWTPEDSTQVPHPFHARDLSGKRRCKAELQNELKLGADADAPLVAFVSRITEQKMADVLPQIAPSIRDRGGQFVICGEGDRSIERTLHVLEAAHPEQVAVRIGYEEPLARRILAGADILAAPARFEPCGLTQMYAMRYGTIPVVRRTGGLADTVIDHGTDEASSRAQGTGFLFDRPIAADLAHAINRAIDLYREPVAWRKLQGRAMCQDFRWRRSAARYRELYAALTCRAHREEIDSERDGMAADLRLTGS